MKINRGIVTAVIVVVILCWEVFVSTAKAQETFSQSNTGLITVATVNIYRAQLVKQDNNRLTIGFDLSNRQNVQPGIKYAVQLIQNTDNKGQSLIDEKVYYEDIVNLNENETIHKEIIYEAPAYLNGKYQVWVISQNEKGMTLAMGTAGEITLNGNSQYIELKDCYLTVQNEKDSPQYALTQGVDISQEETLLLNCNSKNNFSSNQTLTPNFNTYYRTSFGKLISSDKSDLITLKANEEKLISLAIPKANDPQAYDTILELKNSSNQAVSNEITAHYVIQGISATIQNLRLDKDYYQKNEEAKISFVWSSSAGNFPNARATRIVLEGATANINIQSGNNDCIDPITQNLDENQNPFINLNQEIIQDCINPNLAVSIKDKDGKVLDAQTYSIQSKNISQAKPSGQQQEEKATNIQVLTVVLVLSILLILIVIIHYFKKKRQNSQLLKTLLLCFLIGGGLFLFDLRGARGDTYLMGDYTIRRYYRDTYQNSWGYVEKIIKSENITPDYGEIYWEWENCNSSWIYCNGKSYFYYNGNKIYPESYNWNCEKDEYGNAYNSSCLSDNEKEKFVLTQNGSGGFATFNLDDDTYLPNETAVASAKLDVFGCANDGISARAFAGINGVYKTLIDAWSSTWGTFYGSQNFSVQSTPGSYKAWFVAAQSSHGWGDYGLSIRWWGIFGYGESNVNVTIPYTVIDSAPTISVWADSSTIDYASSTTLRWTSANASYCYGLDGWYNHSTSGAVGTGTLYGTTTYSMTCYNSSWTASATGYVTVYVRAAPTLSFWTDSGAVDYASSTTLRWSSSNTSYCYIWGGIYGTWTNTSGAAGTGTLYSTTGYGMTCYNSAWTGSVTKYVTVTVLPPPTLSFTADSTTVDYGESTTLRWTSANASYCYLWGGPYGSSTSSGLWTTTSGNRGTDSLSDSTTYYMVCYNSSYSAYAAKSVSITVKSPPTLTVSTGSCGKVTISPNNGYPVSECTSSYCSYTYKKGTSVTLSASAITGSFSNWSYSCSGSTNPTCNITMDSSKTASASFNCISSCTDDCGDCSGLCSGQNCYDSCGTKICSGTKNCKWIEAAP